MTHFMAAFAVAFTFALQSANAQDDVGRWYLGGNIGETKFGGIGGEVAPFSNKKIKLRMEYEMFELENFYDTDDLFQLTDDLDTDLEFLSIGITYTF